MGDRTQRSSSNTTKLQQRPRPIPLKNSISQPRTVIITEIIMENERTVSQAHAWLLAWASNTVRVR